MVPYFTDIGFAFNPKHNPADDLLDFVAGQLPDNSPALFESNLASTPKTPQDVQQYIDHHWRQHSVRDVPQVAVHHSANNGEPETDAQFDFDDRGATFLRQFHLCHLRSIKQQYRLAGAYGLEMGVGGLAGLVMGKLCFQYANFPIVFTLQVPLLLLFQICIWESSNRRTP